MAKAHSADRVIGKGCGVAVLIVFVGFWSVITLIFDILLGSLMYKQIRANEFPSTTGVIVESSTERTGRRGRREGSSEQAHIRFEYTVDDRPYESNQWRYDSFGTSGRLAREIVARFPKGSERPVYYNPANPAEAVLVPGLLGIDLFIILFLTPFNLVMLTGWAAPFLMMLPRDSALRSGTAVLEKGVVSRVRIVDRWPLGRAVATLGGGAFLSIFILAFATRMNPSMLTMQIWWGVLIAMAIWVYVYNRRFLYSAGSELTIDQAREVLTLPRTRKRKEAVSIPLGRVRDVSLEREKSRGSKGGTRTTYFLYLSTLDGERHLLLKTGADEKAKRVEQMVQSLIWPDRKMSQSALS